MKIEATRIAILTSRHVVTTSLKVAVVVGTILALINHGPSIVSLSLTTQQLYQIVLTYAVPYAVSSYSALSIYRQNLTRQTADTRTRPFLQQPPQRPPPAQKASDQ